MTDVQPIRPICVYSHIRSGSALLLETLAPNFWPEWNLARPPGGRWGHYAHLQPSTVTIASKLFCGHLFWRKKGRGPCIYILRDGRDVAVSTWRTKEFLHPDWQDMPFAAYIRTPLDWMISPTHKRDPRWTIIEHWYNHVRSWMNHPTVCYVRFENLVQQPYKVLRGLSKWLGLPHRGIVVQEPVGYAPHEGTVGRWEQYFTPEDLQHFFRTVPRDFWGLWRPRT